MGGGLVLLDDENAGADAADRELLMAFDLGLLDLDVGDLGAPRPLAEEGDQLLHPALGSLGVDQHAAVLGVPNPPHRPQPLRPSQRRVPIADALHSPTHHGPHRRRRVSLPFGALRHRWIIERCTKLAPSPSTPPSSPSRPKATPT